VEANSTPERLLLFTRTLGLAIIVGLLSFWLANGPLVNAELAAEDALFRIRGPLHEDSPVVIVAIDDASFSATGLRWPWSRNYVAQIIDAVSEGNPSAIAIDLFFYDESIPEEDNALAEAITNAGNVVLVSHITFQDDEGIALQQWNRPLPSLEEAAAATGLTNFPRDIDGSVRRLVVSQEHAGQQLYSWTVHLVRLYNNEDNITIVSGNEAWIGNWLVELYGGFLVVNYRGPAGSIPFYSAYQVADGTIPPQSFAGKIVLIGVTSETLHDSYATPFGSSPPMPGVEINANAVETILSGRYIHPPTSTTTLLIAILTALVGIVLSLRLRPLAGLFITIVLFLGFAALSAFLFIKTRTILSIVSPLLSLGITFVVGTSIQLYEEQRQRAHVRALFDRYVSPTVIDQMLEQPESVALGGQRRELTVLFSDIRGFTSLAEQLPPDDVVTILNEYLSAMTEIVFQHEGMVDKFEGDAILAVFNAPLSVDGHATKAVHCAIAMMDRLATMQADWEATGRQPLQIGIGINTGEAFVGNIGSTQRMEYTVIGDTVNLAARLQDLTKDYNVPILFSEATRDNLASDIPSQFVTTAHVKGRVQAANIYTCAQQASSSSPQ
jgi:adenylate cyclase